MDDFKNEADNSPVGVPFTPGAKLMVVGVGGGGVNAVSRMYDQCNQGVEFVAVNTDSQSIVANEADAKITIGFECTRGMGAGADPSVGRAAAEESEEALREAIKGMDMVFVTAGEGGGTGTGAAPVVARIARELGALTVGVVTRPFSWEGRRRQRVAENGIKELAKEVDTLIVIPNDRLLELDNPDMTMVEAFECADRVLQNGVQGVTNLIHSSATINVDFADVTSVMKNAGSAIMGRGRSSGADRACAAVEEAMNSPLLERPINNAQGVLLYFEGDSKLGLRETSDAVELVREAVHPEANIIFGVNHDPSLGDELQVTLIAAGFDDDGEETLAANNQVKEPAVEVPASVSTGLGATAGAANLGADLSAASTAATEQSSRLPGELPRASRAQHRMPVQMPGRDAFAQQNAEPLPTRIDPASPENGFIRPFTLDEKDEDALDVLPDFMR